MSARREVVAFNIGEYAERLAAATRDLPIDIRHVSLAIPWEEIAARRAGRTGSGTSATAEVASALRTAEVIFGFGLPVDTAALAPALRWVETPATGFDQLNGSGVLERERVTVTTVGGLFAPWVAEHAFALLFGLTRLLERFATAQRQTQWTGRGVEVRGLHGLTMAIVGLGNIGRAVARAAQAFGMQVIGTRRHADRIPPEVDRVYPRAALHAMLAEADVVVLAVAGTPDTEGMIGAAELAAMRPDALLINVSRGFVVDEVALAAVLAERKIAGAGLDVFVGEPLQADSPLWQLPNVLITPHIAVNVSAKMQRCVEHFADNLRRYCEGHALLDRVKGVTTDEHR